MDSIVKSDLVVSSAPAKINLLKKITAPYDSIRKVKDDDILRKRKLRFAENALPECNSSIAKKDASDVLEKRLARFGGENGAKKISGENGARKISGENGAKIISREKSNADILNTLKKRKERFGELTSTLLKSIEEKEKVLKRKSKFGPTKEIKQNDENVKKLKVEQKLDSTPFESATIEEIKEKKVLKKITFEDSDLSLSRDN